MDYHVLIAEDEEITREAVYAGLSRLLPGAEFHAVKNGVEAVAYAKEQEIQVAFLDIRMPEMNGITAAQKIRQLYEDCQIVFLTAYNDFEYVRSALKLDAVDYLLKPFDQATLADAVHKVMKRMGELAAWTAGKNTAPLLFEAGEPVRWLEEEETEAMLGGRLDPAVIPAGVCGLIVAMAGASSMQMQRLKYVLMGMDPGGDIRCLIGRKEDYLFLAAWSMTAETLREQIRRQMELLVARLDRQFGCRLRCGIGSLFFDDGDIQEACLDAFCHLKTCTDKDVIKVSDYVMQGDLLDVVSGNVSFGDDALQEFYHLAGEDGGMAGQ